MAIIELVDLRAGYDGQLALKGVNLEIDQGEILSLIGPNGAGKTTLLKTIGGLISPSSGSLVFRDTDITDTNREILRENATLVFQNPVHFGTTVYKNVAYGLRIRGVDESDVDKRVKETLELLGLSGFESRNARKLSGGEQRRVSLARAVAIDSSILLLDEPGADLDLESKRIVEETLRSLSKDRGTTVVMATHDMFQAKTLASRIATVQDGQIERIGRASTVFRLELESRIGDHPVLNRFRAQAVWIESDWTKGGHLRLRLEGGLTLEATGHRDGDVTIIIPPEDIIISRQAVLSSARNSLKGSVINIEASNSSVLLTVDVGIELVAQITEDSLKRLKIEKGDEVFVTFKASSVTVY
ncbi:MAG: ABC transporter ATP-binding protein [Candidatus Thorarchaeota archaeon]|nr:MAG: ABC transporter ATP-binding protein [Candidatus Thorarchaeota archaeon]